MARWWATLDEDDPISLEPLAKLFAYAAELHPFPDGNSRTRALLLNSKLVQAGGHEVLLYNIGWPIYYMTSYEQVQSYLLEGWCAYEYYAAHGTSPYVALSSMSANSTLTAPAAMKGTAKTYEDETNEAAHIASALYDAGADTCRRPSRLEISEVTRK